MTTATITNPTIISYRRNWGISFAEKVLLPLSSARYELHSRLFSSPPPRPTLAANCSGGASGEGGEVLGGGLKVALSGLVNQQVEELLGREENKELLDGLEKATLRVEIAKRGLAEIEMQEMEARELRDYMSHLENRTSEIAECQREILEARSMVDKAERLLNTGGTEKKSKGEIDINEERRESVKAALISASIGSLASLPISVAQFNDISKIIFSFDIAFVSCALFGVTFRYALRRDLDNFQLKTGIAAAFGLVKGIIGLAMLESGPPLELELGSLVSGAVLVSESLLVFFFAAVGLDFFIKMEFLSPYPIGNPPTDDTNVS